MLWAALFSCDGTRSKPPGAGSAVQGPQDDGNAASAGSEGQDPGAEPWEATAGRSPAELLTAVGNISDAEGLSALEARINLLDDSDLDAVLSLLEAAAEEAAAAKKPAPVLQFALALCYGRKGLAERSYAAVEKAAAEAKAPGAAFIIAALHGRKSLLARTADAAPCALQIEAVPSHARVSVNGGPLEDLPLRREGLRPGVYSLRIVAEGYDARELRLEGKAGDVLRVSERLAASPVAVEKTVDLEPTPFRITVTSEPEGSRVFIDGVESGVTPLSLESLQFGTKEVRVLSSDWRYEDGPASMIDWTPGGSLAHHAALVPKTALFSLSPSSRIPAGAEAYLNGKRLGTLPVAVPDLPFGSHLLELKAEGYENFERRFDWRGNMLAATLQMTMPRKPFIVPTAAIRVDGRVDDWRGIAPLVEDPAGDDKLTDHPGTDLAGVYLARDSRNFYWRMDFADGTPRGRDGHIYEVVVRGDRSSDGWQYFLELRLQYGDGAWRSGVHFRKTKDSQNTEAKESYQGGSYRILDKTIEFSVPFAVIAPYVKSEGPFEAEARFWAATQGDNSSFQRSADSTGFVRIQM